MERLTKYLENGSVALEFNLDITCEKPEMEKILKLIKALQSYEQLEITPDQVREMSRLYQEKCEEVAELKENIYQLNNDCAGLSQENELFKSEINKLKSRLENQRNYIKELRNSYKDLETELEQSVKLPCNVGDTVYDLLIEDIIELEVIAINIGMRKKQNSLVVISKNDIGTNLTFELVDFGKTVFLTREEADKALETIKMECSKEE